MKLAWKYFSVMMALILMVAMAAIAVPAQPVLAAGGWNLQTVDPDEVHSTSIAVDSSGYPHISYHDYTSGALKYAHFNGSTWNIQTVDPVGNGGGGTSIALDGNGYPHISYYDETNGQLKYAYWTGSGWHIEAVSEPATNGRDSSLALDSSGYPHITWSGNGAYCLMYTRWTGSAWETPTNIDVDARTKSLALDSNGYPHISYFVAGSDNYLKYATYNGTDWSTEIVDAPVGDGFVGDSNSLELDSSNRPHIAYSYSLNSDPNSYVKYARLTGSTWGKETVDSSTIQLGYISLSLDSSNGPHISYTSSGEFSLHYARWTGSVWSKETVDPGEFRDTSLALDSNGYPQISYASGGPKSLHYARFFPTPTIIAVDPNSGLQSRTIPVTITGTDLTGATAVSFGAGITVSNVVVNSATQITANIIISGSAAIGAHDVAVTTPGGTATLLEGFTVESLLEWMEENEQSTGSASVAGSATTTQPVSMPNMVIQSASLSAKSVTPGTPITVTANLINKSTVNGNKKVTLYVNGQVETAQAVAVNSGGSSQLTFSVSRSEPGDYNVYVDGVPAGSFKVELFSGNDAILIFSAALIAMAFLIGMVMLWRRQQRV